MAMQYSLICWILCKSGDIIQLQPFPYDCIPKTPLTFRQGILHMDGFYLGYHAAAAILEEIEPCHFAAPKLERNILCMEHHLGYIQSDAAQS